MAKYISVNIGLNGYKHKDEYGQRLLNRIRKMVKKEGIDTEWIVLKHVKVDELPTLLPCD